MCINIYQEWNYGFLFLFIFVSLFYLSSSRFYDFIGWFNERKREYNEEERRN